MNQLISLLLAAVLWLGIAPTAIASELPLQTIVSIGLSEAPILACSENITQAESKASFAGETGSGVKTTGEGSLSLSVGGTDLDYWCKKAWSNDVELPFPFVAGRNPDDAINVSSFAYAVGEGNPDAGENDPANLAIPMVCTKATGIVRPGAVPLLLSSSGENCYPFVKGVRSQTHDDTTLVAIVHQNARPASHKGDKLITYQQVQVCGKHIKNATPEIWQWGEDINDTISCSQSTEWETDDVGPYTQLFSDPVQYVTYTDRSLPNVTFLRITAARTPKKMVALACGSYRTGNILAKPSIRVSGNHADGSPFGWSATTKCNVLPLSYTDQADPTTDPNPLVKEIIKEVEQANPTY